MEPQLEPIKQDIDDIRESMVAKIEAIEDKVKGTVEDTVEKVKGSVEDTVETVRQAFDIKQQVGNHPWAALGIAVVAGYVLGSVSDDDTNASSYRFASSDGPAQQGSGGRGFFGDFLDQFGDEIDTIKTAAIASAVAMGREVVGDALPGFRNAYQQAQQGQPSTNAAINPVRP